MPRLFPRRLIIPLYILRAHAGPFLFSLATLMFLFILQFVTKNIDQLVGKGLSAWVILEFVVLSLSWMFVLAVPMSVLVAVLMAFGDLSSRNEITAMRASGVSIYRMLLAPLTAATLVAILMVFFNNDVLPETNYRLKALMVDIRRKKPTLTLVKGVFSQDIPGYSMLVRRTFEHTNDLEGVTLYDYTNPNLSVVITAHHGAISFSPDYRKLLLDLHDGEINELDLMKPTGYRRVRFQDHRIAMNVEGFDFERSSATSFSRGDRELSARAMHRIVDSLRVCYADFTKKADDIMVKEASAVARSDTAIAPAQATPGAPPLTAALLRARQLNSTIATLLFQMDGLSRQIDQYEVEIHKKYSIPVACLVFVLLGAPLGIMSRRGGFGVAASLSLGFFILYWACLIGGEKLADRDIVSPLVGMWSANFFLGTVGLYLVIRTGKEAMLINWDALSRLLPARWRMTSASDRASV
jgi:lipopolysaccharide export system permease protein